VHKFCIQVITGSGSSLGERKRELPQHGNYRENYDDEFVYGAPRKIQILNGLLNNPRNTYLVRLKVQLRALCTAYD
jgi:hypothetical protein